MNGGFARRAVPHSLAGRIRLYAFALAMLVFALLGGVWMTLTLKEIPAGQLAANKATVRVMGEVLASDINGLLGDLRQLSRSSLVWTSLTDSTGREAYLKPFLRSRMKSPGANPILLLDYRGRPVAGVLSEMPNTATHPDLLRKATTLVNGALDDRQARSALVALAGQPFLLVVYPVLNPYSQETNGALASLINLREIFARRLDSLVPEIGLDVFFAAQAFTMHGERQTARHFPVEFNLSLDTPVEGGQPALYLYSTRDAWQKPVVSRLLWSLPLAILIGLIAWQAAGSIARKISQRLERLAAACRNISRGQGASIPEDTGEDEIGLLSRTLRQAVESYVHINNRLESLVAERTRQLAESESHFRSFFEKNASVMLIVDPMSGTIAAANGAATSFYGYPTERFVGMPVSELNAMTEEFVEEQGRRILAEEHDHFFVRHALASGEIRDVEVHLTPIESEGRFLLFSIIHDVTERNRTEARLRQAATVFSHAREGIMITDSNGIIIDTNEACSQITGYGREEVLGRTPQLLGSGLHGKDFYAALWRELRERGFWSGEIWNRRKNGEVYAELLTISAVRDERGNTRQYVALFSDITPIKENERKLERFAHHDALTDLPNRILLADRLQQAMAQAERRGSRLGLAYLDLDGFKAINDEHGHAAGDQLLMTLSRRMRDTLARIGGDEFVAILIDLADEAALQPTLDRLLMAASLPVNFGATALQVSASIGITFYPQDGEINADQLLRQADQAMYRAKDAGKNNYRLFARESAPAVLVD